MPRTSRKPKLRVVSINHQPRSKVKWTDLDPLGIFIHRSQISIGTQLLNFGRLDHNSVWEVREIYNITPNGTRRRTQSIDSHHTNIVVLRLGSNETRHMLFQNLSYSAIWRLSQP